MGGNYSKGLYNQLMEVMAKLDVLEQEHRKEQETIKSLTAEVVCLRKENNELREEVSSLKYRCAVLEEENIRLKKENLALRNDNERMKRILNNDSTNSSIPPSKDDPGKAPNTYNSRKPTKKKPGAQKGHKGNGLSKAEVKKKIEAGIYEHRIENIGTPNENYVTRYRIDLKIKPVATEYRIYADEDGKFQIPAELTADVSYGNTIRAMTAFLYSEGVVATDRIRTFINSISGDTISVSEGSVYEFCKKFGEQCSKEIQVIEQQLLNSYEICTDATTVKTNGVQTYIRNFSTSNNVLYCCGNSKNLKTLKTFKILKDFTGVLTHDHETTMYNFGTRHGECNVHLNRYLLKNTQETGNVWSHNLSCFLNGMNQARKELIKQGYVSFTAEQLMKYSRRYDEIIALGEEQSKQTKGQYAEKEETKLLRRLKKYKKNHLLFLYDFRVHFSNNISEKDLRICKNRQKMAGGFRKVSGREMYCKIISFIETVKRRKLNIFQSIINLMDGTPVIN